MIIKKYRFIVSIVLLFVCLSGDRSPGKANTLHQNPLDPQAIPKFVEPLVIPPIMPPARVRRRRRNRI